MTNTFATTRQTTSGITAERFIGEIGAAKVVSIIREARLRRIAARQNNVSAPRIATVVPFGRRAS